MQAYSFISRCEGLAELRFDGGGCLPLPNKEYGRKFLDFLNENKLPIGLFLLGLVLA